VTRLLNSPIKEINLPIGQSTN